MLPWEKAIEKFMASYRDDPYFEGLLVCGSYVSGKYLPESDIDVQLVMSDQQTWRERGDTYVDGFLVEYFINPKSSVLKSFETDYKNRSACNAVMFGFGRILVDNNGVMKELQEKALEYYRKPFGPYDEYTFSYKLYRVWHLMGQIKSLRNTANDINFVSYCLIAQLIELYYYKNGLAILPFHKLERILYDESYRDSYHVMRLPDPEFIRLLKPCLYGEKEERYTYVTAFYDYVIANAGGFDITQFKLRQNLK